MTSSSSVPKLVTLAEAARISEEMAEAGRTLVLTNGCFDLLHVGHTRYLQAARALGDALLVAVNGDESVRQLKGERRPINPECDRAEVLAALSCIDYVTIFPSVRATDVIRQVRPQAYAKGGDYTPESLYWEEREALVNAGTRIHILPLQPGKSTTATIERWSR